MNIECINAIVDIIISYYLYYLYYHITVLPYYRITLSNIYGITIDTLQYLWYYCGTYNEYEYIKYVTYLYTEFCVNTSYFL